MTYIVMYNYKNIFNGAILDPTSQSVESWLTTKGGGYVAAGVGGGITGKGAHELVIDDPVKNRDDAESEYNRDSVWDWYTSTAYTRLAPGGGILVILTRWHDDDLAGRLLQAAAEAVDREFVYIELEEASPTIPHITDPRSQSPRIPPADAGRRMLDARSQMPDPRVSF